MAHGLNLAHGLFFGIACELRMVSTFLEGCQKKKNSNKEECVVDCMANTA